MYIPGRLRTASRPFQHLDFQRRSYSWLLPTLYAPSFSSSIADLALFRHSCDLRKGKHSDFASYQESSLSRFRTRFNTSRGGQLRQI